MPPGGMASEGNHLDAEGIEAERPGLGVEFVPVAVERAHTEDEAARIPHSLIEPARGPLARPGHPHNRGADRLGGDPPLHRVQVQAASRKSQILAEEDRHRRATSRYRSSRAVTRPRSWAMKVRAQSVARP